MGPLVVVAESGIDGLGVFTTVGFAPGGVVLTIDDSRVVDAAHPVLPEERRHCDYLEGGKTVLMQIPERYINHSCRPNVFVRTVHGLNCALALRQIRAGEEITYDYCVNGYGNVVWHCNCGAEGCRRTIYSDFFHLPLEVQKEYLPLLNDWFRKERARYCSNRKSTIGGLLGSGREASTPARSRSTFTASRTRRTRL